MGLLSKFSEVRKKYDLQLIKMLEEKYNSITTPLTEEVYFDVVNEIFMISQYNDVFEKKSFRRYINFVYEKSKLFEKRIFEIFNSSRKIEFFLRVCLLKTDYQKIYDLYTHKNSYDKFIFSRFILKNLKLISNDFLINFPFGTGLHYFIGYYDIPNDRYASMVMCLTIIEFLKNKDIASDVKKIIDNSINSLFSEEEYSFSLFSDIFNRKYPYPTKVKRIILSLPSVRKLIINENEKEYSLVKSAISKFEMDEIYTSLKKNVKELISLGFNFQKTLKIEEDVINRIASFDKRTTNYPLFILKKIILDKYKEN